MILDSETKAVELPEDHGNELRLWLRLLTCTTLIEGEVRSRLRERFDVTLPRFDLMAQLDKVPDGMTLSDVSKRMMVSQRQRHRAGRAPRRIRPSRPAHIGHRPARAGDPADEGRPRRVSQNGRGARDLDRRHIFGSDPEGRPRTDAPVGQDQGLGAEVRAKTSIVSLERDRRLRGRIQQPGAGSGKPLDHCRLGKRCGCLPRTARATPISYGPGARNCIDFFPGGHEGPIVVFIHGGYWQALDGSFFSHLARGLNACGIGVAIPSYDLCPGVTVDRIIEEMRMAMRELARLGQPLIVSGHSAGGHLAACMLATDWRAYDASLPPDIVIAAYAISGLFDLRPLVGTSINAALHLDDATARAASPLFWKVPRAEVSMRSSAKTKARNICGKAGPSSISGARPAFPQDSASFPQPTISRRLRPWPIRTRRWCRG